MNTLMIKASLDGVTPGKNESAFSRYVLRYIKDMHRKGSLDSGVKNYLIKHIDPKGSGFLSRWFDFYNFADEMRVTEKSLEGKTDIQRLEHAMVLADRFGFATAFDASNEIKFTGDDSDKLQNVGCFIVTSAVLGLSKDGCYGGIFPVYYTAVDQDALKMLIDFVQASAFNIALDKHPYKIGQLAVLDLIPYRLLA